MFAIVVSQPENHSSSLTSFPLLFPAVAAHILTMFNYRGVATAASGKQERVEELGFSVSYQTKNTYYCRCFLACQAPESCHEHGDWCLACQEPERFLKTKTTQFKYVSGSWSR